MTRNKFATAVFFSAYLKPFIKKKKRDNVE